MISKLTLVAAVAAAQEVDEFEADEELHSQFLARKITRTYKFGQGWCGHKGSYVQYADLTGDGRADITCSDTMGRHWHRLAFGNGSFGPSVYSKQITGWCRGVGNVTRFADLNGDRKAEMTCDNLKGGHWAMLGRPGAAWMKKFTKKHSPGWCAHKGGYTQYGDTNGDGKADLHCDDTLGRHWVAYSKGNGTFIYRYHKALYKWCSHPGSYTQWVDINGDGKVDLTCQDKLGRHWGRLTTGSGLTFGPSVMHPKPWCKGGITRYANFLWDAKHPLAKDMMCDMASKTGTTWHFVKPSLGNGHFSPKSYKVFATAFCTPQGTHYADVNGNKVDDLLCSMKGSHWAIVH